MAADTVLILQACYLALHLGGHVCGLIKSERVCVHQF